MAKIDINVFEGQILVNCVYLVVKKRNFFAIEIDTSSKYPSLNGWSIKGHGALILELVASERTLNCGQTQRPTSIVLDSINPNKRWTFSSHISKYTVVFTGYTYKFNRVKTLYENENLNK